MTGQWIFGIIGILAMLLVALALYRQGQERARKDRIIRRVMEVYGGAAPVEEIERVVQESLRMKQ